MDIDTEILFLEAQLPILFEWIKFSLQLAKRTKTAPICKWPSTWKFNPANLWVWLELPDEFSEEEREAEIEALTAKQEEVLAICSDMGWTAFWEAKERHTYYFNRLNRLKQLKAAGEKLAPNRTKYKDWKQPICDTPLTDV